jgi:hypothetical protein
MAPPDTAGSLYQVCTVPSPVGDYVRWDSYAALEARCEELEIDAQFGRIAMQFVDRAGDYCDTDPASRICDEFHAAFCAQIDANEEKIRARMAGEVKP